MAEQRPSANLSLSYYTETRDIDLDEDELERTSLAAHDAIFSDEDELEIDGATYPLENRTLINPRQILCLKLSGRRKGRYAEI